VAGTERTVKVTIVFDDKGSARIVKQVGDDAGHSTTKLEHLDKGVKELGKSFGGLKGLIGAGLGTLGLGGALYGVKELVSNTSEMSEEVEKFHALSGISAQQSLYFTAALKARGVSGQQAGKAFGFLSKNLQTAERQWKTYGFALEKAGVSQQKANLAFDQAVEKGQPLSVAQAALTAGSTKMTSQLGVQAKAFQELGINLGHFMHLSEPEKLEAITSAFERMSGGVKKTALLKDLFGRGGQNLAGVLQGGALGWKHQTEEAKKFFPILHGGEQGLTEFIAKQAESKMAWEGLQYTLGVKLMPVLTRVYEWFAKFLQEIEHGHGIWGMLGQDIAKVVNALKSVFKWFEENKTAAKALEYILGILATAWAVSKVIEFYNALKKLFFVEQLANAFKGLAAAEGEAGAAAVTTEAEAAPLLATLAPLAVIAGGAAIATQIPIPKALGGEGHSLVTEASHLLPFGTTQSAGISGRRELANIRRAEAHKHALSHSQWAAQERWDREHTVGSGTEKVDVHIDGQKVAEALMKNERATRRISEGISHYTQKRQARL